MHQLNFKDLRIFKNTTVSIFPRNKVKISLIETILQGYQYLATKTYPTSKSLTASAL